MAEEVEDPEGGETYCLPSGFTDLYTKPINKRRRGHDK